MSAYHQLDYEARKHNYADVNGKNKWHEKVYANNYKVWQLNLLFKKQWNTIIRSKLIIDFVYMCIGNYNNRNVQCNGI